jgi:hypothetical protein
MNYDKDMGVLGALPKAVDGEFARGVEAAANTDDLISFLTDGEGDTVTFCCSNPDFNGLPNECVSVNAMWTNWIDRDFRADTRRDCLLAAVHAMKEAAQFGSEALILSPASVGRGEPHEVTDADRCAAAFGFQYPSTHFEPVAQDTLQVQTEAIWNEAVTACESAISDLCSKLDGCSVNYASDQFSDAFSALRRSSSQSSEKET